MSIRLAITLGCLAVLGAPLVIALAGLSGVGHRWVDILAQFTAPALAVAAALTLLCLALRQWLPAGAGCGVMAILLLAVWPQWFPTRGRPAPDAPVVRLYSANLWARNTDVEAIARSIAVADADIVVLIELGDAPAARLDDILRGYPHRAVTARVDRPSGAARTLVASRFPVRRIPDLLDGLSSVQAVVETPIGPIDVLGVHLTRPWPYKPQWGQISQARSIARRRAMLAGPVIVAGDFNSVSSARIGRQVQGEADLIPAPGWPGTWPSHAPAAIGMTIDQVYRSPDLALLDRRLGRPTGSDHRPVITEFTLAKP